MQWSNYKSDTCHGSTAGLPLRVSKVSFLLSSNEASFCYSWKWQMFGTRNIEYLMQEHYKDSCDSQDLSFATFEGTVRTYLPDIFCYSSWEWCPSENGNISLNVSVLYEHFCSPWFWWHLACTEYLFSFSWYHSQYNHHLHEMFKHIDNMFLVFFFHSGASHFQLDLFTENLRRWFEQNNFFYGGFVRTHNVR